MAFLTLEEAKLFSGKSESTLRRLIKKALDSKKKRKYIKTKSLSNGGYQYLIDPALLTKKKKKKVAEKLKSSQGPVPSEQKRKTDLAEIEVLKKYVDSLERQLAVKDKQMFELMEQNRDNLHLLEKINQALIKFRVPEYIETQYIQEPQVLTPAVAVEQPTKKAKSKPKEPVEKGSLSDWLNAL